MDKGQNSWKLLRKYAMIKLSYYINSSLKEVSDGLAGVNEL